MTRLGLHPFIYLGFFFSFVCFFPKAMVKRLYNPKSCVADFWIFMCAQDESACARRRSGSRFSSFHPAVSQLRLYLFLIAFLWLYLTALNCCIPGCFYYSYFFKSGSFGWERRHQPPRPPPRRLCLHSCSDLETKAARLFLREKIRRSNVLEGLFKGRWRGSVFPKDNHCLEI